MDCYTVDYNPVAYLIQKAVLEYPRKYKDLSKDVLRYGIKVIELSKQEVGDLYPDKKLVYFYARCITCPYCKHRAP
jgi:Adenine-specific DNA methylase containing a Zn-ribbon